MKKKNLLLLSSVLLICSCKNNDVVTDDTSSSGKKENEDIKNYTTIYSSDEEVIIYGYVGMEAFDLNSINASRVASSKLEYETDSDLVEINDNKLSFKKVGIATIYGYDDDSSEYKVNVVVNDSKENQYNYPYDIDYSTYSLKSGTKSNITSTENSVTVNSKGTGMADWTRITYDLNQQLNKYLYLEVDATVNSYMDTSRWFGFVFNDLEKSGNKAPFYQYDVRIDPTKANSMELTHVSDYSSNSYTYDYPYQGKDDFAYKMDPGTTVKLGIAINDNKVKCYYNDSFEFEAIIGESTGGNIGFQTSGCSVTFSNLKIAYQEESKDYMASKTITNAKESDSYVDSNYSSSLRPNIIATGKTEDELLGVGLNVTQIYAVAKNENDTLNLYDLDGNKMDINLEYIYKWFKGDYIVNLEVNDNATVDLIKKIMKASAVLEYALFSSNIDVLKYAKQVNPLTRLGYVSTASSITTNEDVSNECIKAGSGSAYQIVIDAKILTKQLVTAFTGRGYSVIGKACDGKEGSVIDAALDGCANILVKYSKVATSEVKMLETDSIFASNSLFYQPYATAHRGTGTNGDTIDATYCENTLSSFDKAFERGALALEIDVHTTKDKKLAVIHDDNTAGVSNTNLTVKSSTLAQLQALKLKIGNDHIPSLDEVFTRYGTEQYKDKTLVIEVKDNTFETGKAVIEMSKQYNWYGRFVLITFNATTAKQLHDYDPSVPSAYLGTVYRNSVDTFYSAYKTYYLNGVGLSTNMACIDKYGNEEHNARGEVNWVWTFNQINNARMTTYLNNGLRAMTTNHIRYFENNYYKLVSDTEISMQKGSSKTLEAKAVSYVGETSINNFDIILISGNATINGTSITKNDDNEVKVCLKYKAQWTDAGTNLTTFYVYSDVITIK